MDKDIDTNLMNHNSWNIYEPNWQFNATMLVMDRLSVQVNIL